MDDFLTVQEIEQGVDVPQNIHNSTLIGLPRLPSLDSSAMDQLSTDLLPVFAQDSDSELPNSQKSSTSGSLLDFRKLGVRLSSQGSVTDSDDGFFPFSQEYHVNDVDSLLSKICSKHSDLDKGALFDPTTDAEMPRSKTPKPQADSESADLPDTCRDFAQAMATPPKGANTSVTADPLTPMANLKMLISAASPEIRNRERAKQREIDTQQEESDVGIDSEDNVEQLVTDFPARARKSKNSKRMKDELVEEEGAELDMAQPISRKDKSLGLLCQRFLARYPEYPETYENIKISLDEASKELNVERRRIYDIVNVLESVEIVSRVAKNKYSWHGKTQLPNTLARLKALGQLEGFAEQLGKLKENGLDVDGAAGSPRKKLPFRSNDESNIQDCSVLRGSTMPTYNIRKDKSLGIMSQKFLMLFLVSEPSTVNLDQAAKILIGGSTGDQTETSKFKTKIRRLYDIANILTSLKLIRKVHVTETRGRKPAFQYVGPEINILNLEDYLKGGLHRPISRHSLLDPVQAPMHTEGSSLLRFTVQERSFSSLDISTSTQSNSKVSHQRHPPMKKSFSRHSSFEQICKVAEQERRRLYSESRSQPTSPIKTNSGRQQAVSTIPTSSLQPDFCKSSDGSKQYVVIRGSRPSQALTNSTDSNSSGSTCTVTSSPPPSHKLDSVADMSKKPEVVSASDEASDTSSDDSKRTVVKLTKQELNVIIKTLSGGETASKLKTAEPGMSSPGLVDSLLAIVNRVQESQATTEPAEDKESFKTSPKIRLVEISQSTAETDGDKTRSVKRGAEENEADEMVTVKSIRLTPTQPPHIPGIGKLLHGAESTGTEEVKEIVEAQAVPRQPTTSKDPNAVSAFAHTPIPRVPPRAPPPGSAGATPFSLAATSPSVVMLSSPPESLGGLHSQSSEVPQVVRRYVTLSRSVCSPYPAPLGAHVATPTGRVTIGHKPVASHVPEPASRLVLNTTSHGSSAITPGSRVVVSKLKYPSNTPQVMVTPTNSPLTNGIQPSGGIVNLLPYFSSPNADAGASPRLPVRLVRVNSDFTPSPVFSPSDRSVVLSSPTDGMAGGSTTHSVLLTPQSATASNANMFYYSTPSTLSPSLTSGTRVLTTPGSAFQPVSTTSTTARRLALPKP